MNRAQIIVHTKSYMDMLSQGIDPISREKITGDSVVLQERMQKCFAFVAALLDELIQNNGFVPLSPNDAARYEIVERKTPFSLTHEQLSRVFLSGEPVAPGVFLKRINRLVDESRMEKLSLRNVNAWLLEQGYITESKETATINKTVHTPAPCAAEIGIKEQELVDPETGELKKKLVLTREAQAHLLAHLDEIIACSPKRT